MNEEEKDLFRGIKSEISTLSIGVWLFGFVFLLFAIHSCVAKGESLRHDPNMDCHDFMAQRASVSPLKYCEPNDLSMLEYYVEAGTGKLWLNEFVKEYLQCPNTYFDLNFDGRVDLKDFAVLARCKIWYKTKTGTRYHRRSCTYLRTSCIPITDPNGLLPCSVCIIAENWINN